MKCKDCKHWQGTEYSEWADCYRVVGLLNEDLKYCFLSNRYGTVEQYFQIPFDPHDAKYWSSNPLWCTLYESMTQEGLKEGVRVAEDVIDDIIFDNQNGERVGKLKLKYFQTHKEYECDDKSN